MTAPQPASALNGLRLLADETRWKLITVLRDSDRQVAELVAATGLAQNLVSYHLNMLRQAGLVNAHRSDADGRVIYYSLHLAALTALLAQVGHELALPEPTPPPLPPVTVAFLCRANSARSQMAEGWLRAERRASAGSERRHPAATDPPTSHRRNGGGWRTHRSADR